MSNSGKKIINIIIFIKKKNTVYIFIIRSKILNRLSWCIMAVRLFLRRFKWWHWREIFRLVSFLGLLEEAITSPHTFSLRIASSANILSQSSGGCQTLGANTAPRLLCVRLTPFEPVPLLTAGRGSVIDTSSFRHLSNWLVVAGPPECSSWKPEQL